MQASPFAVAVAQSEEQKLSSRQKHIERKLRFLERKTAHFEAQLEDWLRGSQTKPYPQLNKTPKFAHVPDHFTTELLTWYLWRKDLPEQESPEEADRLYALTKVVIIAAVRGLARVLVECKLPPGFRDTHSEAEMIATIVRGLTGLSDFSLAHAEQAMKEAPVLHLMAINVDAASRRLLYGEPWVPLADNTVRSTAMIQSVQRFVDETKKQWFLEDKDPFEKFKVGLFCCLLVFMSCCLQFSVSPRELAKLGRNECVKCKRR